MLEITNKINDRFSSQFLGNLVRWVGKEVGLPTSWINRMKVKFKYLPPKSRSHFRGHSSGWDREVLVSLSQNPEFYPFFDRMYGMSCSYLDIVDALVAVTAHELYHQYQDCKRIKYHRPREVESSAYSMEIKILKKLRENRAETLQNLGHWDPLDSLKEVSLEEVTQYLQRNLMWKEDMTVKDLLILFSQRG